jgi:hypothetical protein
MTFTQRYQNKLAKYKRSMAWQSRRRHYNHLSYATFDALFFEAQIGPSQRIAFVSDHFGGKQLAELDRTEQESLAWLLRRKIPRRMQ